MTLLRSFALVAALAGSAVAQTATTPPPAPAKKGTASTPAPPPPAKRAEISQADADKFLAFFNKFVDAVVASKEDCTKLAASMNTLIDQNQPIIKTANEAKAAGKDLPQATKDKMMGRVKEIMPAMQKCSADPKVQAAMKRMEDGGKAGATKPAPTKAAPPAKTAPTATKK